jgi:hypothetical protein
VRKNLGDALTYEVLTNDKETVLGRSDVRSASERLKANLGVGFNHNLDPGIRLDDKNQNAIIPLETSLTPQKVKNKHKRRHNILPKGRGNVATEIQEQQSRAISTVNPEETAGCTKSIRR